MTSASKAESGAATNGMDLTADHMENGRWYNAEGIPTFKVEDGTLDYAAFSGYRRYHAECHVCHGPDGEGSTYAPALKDSVLRMDYYDFQQVVASGKQEVNAASNKVMPAFGTNKNVWCYIDDIYVYLLVRGTDSIGRGRPAKNVTLGKTANPVIVRRIVEAVLGDAYQEALGGEVHWNDFNSVTDAWKKFLAYLESVEGSTN